MVFLNSIQTGFIFCNFFQAVARKTLTFHCLVSDGERRVFLWRQTASRCHERVWSVWNSWASVNQPYPHPPPPPRSTKWGTRERERERERIWINWKWQIFQLILKDTNIHRFSRFGVCCISSVQFQTLPTRCLWSRRCRWSVSMRRFEVRSLPRILRSLSKLPYDLEVGPNDRTRCQRAPRDSCRPNSREGSSEIALKECHQ
jgi:hypothetical protein